MSELNVESQTLGAFAAPLAEVEVEVLVSVGNLRVSISDLYNLDRSVVFPLDRKVGEPLGLYIGKVRIGTAELEEGEGENSGELFLRILDVEDRGK